MDIYTVYKITCLPNNNIHIDYTKNELKMSRETIKRKYL